jgi:hypothetical protein
MRRGPSSPRRKTTSRQATPSRGAMPGTTRRWIRSPRLLLAVMPGKRTLENCQTIVQEVKGRTGGRTDLWLTSDAHAPDSTAIEDASPQLVPVPNRRGPGRPPHPKRVMPAD